MPGQIGGRRGEAEPVPRPARPGLGNRAGQPQAAGPERGDGVPICPRTGLPRRKRGEQLRGPTAGEQHTAAGGEERV